MGGKDMTLYEALRVRVIASMDEADDEHRTWINARLAEQLYFCTVLPGLAVIGQTNYDEYTW